MSYIPSAAIQQQRRHMHSPRALRAVSGEESEEVARTSKYGEVEEEEEGGGGCGGEEIGEEKGQARSSSRGGR